MEAGGDKDEARAAGRKRADASRKRKKLAAETLKQENEGQKGTEEQQVAAAAAGMEEVTIQDLPPRKREAAEMEAQTLSGSSCKNLLC